jgi:purine-binding chemotaxis protein CheW
MDELSLLVRVGLQLCALPVECVAETLRPQPVRAIAGAPPFVRGIAVLRGVPVPVIDAALTLGAAAASSGITRFVSLKAADRRVALAVDEVVGVRRIGRQQLSELPPLLDAAPDQVVAAVGNLDGELLIVLRSGTLVPEHVWATIEAEAQT